MKAIDELGFHPVTKLFPRPSEEEVAKMSEFLLKVGCPFNVISWNDLIISDRYMVEICRKLKVQFKVTEFEGTEEEAIKHAWDLNNHRRHYEGKEQKAMVGAKLAKMLEEAARERQRQGTLAPNGAKGRSTEKAAEDELELISTDSQENPTAVIKPNPEFPIPEPVEVTFNEVLNAMVEGGRQRCERMITKIERENLNGIIGNPRARRNKWVAIKNAIPLLEIRLRECIRGRGEK